MQFQSLIGIIDDFNRITLLETKEDIPFQSLIGIIDDFNFKFNTNEFEQYPGFNPS